MSFGKGDLASIIGNGPLEPRLSNKQTSFHKISADYGQKRKPLGWITYYKGKYNGQGYLSSTTIGPKK